METTGSNGGDPCRHQYYVRFSIRGEHSAPTPNCSSFFIRVTASHQNGKDIERDEASVCDKGEEVIAGGATGWSCFWITD